MKSISAKVEGEIIDLGALALKEQVFSHGAFWCGRLDDPQFDASGVFQADDSLISTVFDLASTTKALATTPLALKAAWSQGLDARSTLAEVFPKADFSSMEAARDLFLSDILRHEAGLPAWNNFFVRCCENDEQRNVKEALQQASKSRFLDHRNVYSDLGMILLGILLESNEGKPASELFLDFVRDDLSLNLEGLKLGPSWTHQPSDCVDTGYCPVRQRILRGEVHDENAWALGGYTGHTGLFGSTEAVVKYLRAFAVSKVGGRVLRENSAWAARDEKSNSGLGWRTARDVSSEVFGEGRGIGHMGFTGTAFWIDPKTNTFSVLLTNRVALARTANIPALRNFRRSVFGRMFEHLRSVQAWKP